MATRNEELNDRIDDVIAIRRLFLTDDLGNEKEVRVCMGKPYRDPQFGEYWCQYQITGIGAEKVRSVAGYDAVQAIQGAMTVISGDLQALNEGCGFRLRWPGGDENLGFLVPN